MIRDAARWRRPCGAVSGRGLLPSGGVSREDMSRMPDMHMYMVRGMGVAESESTSMPRAACIGVVILY